MSLELKKTKDGSHTIYNSNLDETYHSIYGAITESKHVFIHNGLKFWVDNHQKSTIKVLEMGLGTGLNVLLSVQYSIDKAIEIVFETVENDPLPDRIISELNYSELVKIRNGSKIFDCIHTGKWNEKGKSMP